MNTAELIAAMDAHDAERVKLDAAATALGLDAKKIKAIRKAEAVAAKAREELTRLMGEPAPAATAQTEAQARAENDVAETFPDAAVEAKKGGK